MRTAPSLNSNTFAGFSLSGAERGAPRYMEWYAAFGLVVAVVRLYLELLRLLAKLQSRN